MNPIIIFTLVCLFIFLVYGIVVMLTPKKTLGDYAHQSVMNNLKRVIYIDYKIDWSNMGNTILGAVQGGYNVIILAFAIPTTSGTIQPVDAVLQWSSLPESQRDNIVNQVHSAGAVLLISVGGSTWGVPTTSQEIANYQNLGVEAGKLATLLGVDGVDFDLEEFSPSFSQDVAKWVAQISIDAKKNGARIFA